MLNQSDSIACVKVHALNKERIVMLTLPLITKIGDIVTEHPVATLPSRLAIQVQTSGGPKVLEITRDAAVGLVAELGKYLQAHGSP